ncbi:MAG: methylmalonyl-CoA mutase family protein, partial [Planctomycetota bacterium]
LRTQQIVAHETGVQRTVDPLGGSWYVEALTDRLETDANEIIKHIDDMGGCVEGIHQGYFRRAIAEASYRYGQEMETHDRIVVGVNAYTDGNEAHQVEILQIPHKVEEDQCARLADFRRDRDSGEVERALDAIRDAARKEANVMPALVDGALARCTLGEMVQAMGDVYGRYTSGPEW